MKKTVFTFGLIAGAIMSLMMVLTVPFMDRLGFEKGEVIGYTTMVVALLLTYFGIRTYRENVAGGTISFGRGVAVGLLITAVAAACYTAAWEVVYFNYMPDFFETYQAHQIDKARAAGKSDAALLQMRAEGERNATYYRNPMINSAFTFLEPLPVGVLVTLVSAGILQRKRKLNPLMPSA
jgi:hypothetical protein